MSWLAERYPLIFKRMDDPSKPRFDCLYIDFNSIIHFSTAFIDPKKAGGFDELISEIIRYLVTLVQIVQPKTLIYISVDGTPPYAKCVNNRSARLREMMRGKKGKDDDVKFEIVAGSTFMETLHLKLLETIKELTEKDRFWSKPKVIYSSYHTPGEAEHKIFEFIQKTTKLPSFDPKTVHCMFSIDSDMFFLALSTKLPFLCIMRESAATASVSENAEFLKNEKSTSSAFELLYVNLAREYMTLDFYEGKEDPRLYDDFISLVFFMGNDFIPEFQELPAQKETFDRIVKCYKKAIVSQGLHLVENGHFIPESIDKLLDLILVEAIISGATTKPADDRIFARFSKEIEKGNTEISKELCEKEIENLDWVLQYYTGECPSWDFYYPFDVSPPISMLKDAFHSYKQHHFERGTPIEPFECMLITCPLEGKTDIPKAVLSLTEEDSEIGYLFPHSYVFEKLSPEMRKIAFPPRKLFTEAYKNIKENIPEKEAKRTTVFGDTLIANGSESMLDISSIEFEKKTEEWPPLYPSLNRNQIWTSFGLSKVNLFILHEPSKLETLVLNVKYRGKGKRAIDFANTVGEEVSFDWPFVKPGIVYSVSDSEVTYELGEDFEAIERKTNLEVDYPNSILKEDYLKTRGINFSKMGVVFAICPLKVSSITEDFFTVSEEPIFVPYQMVISEDIIDVSKYFRRKVISKPVAGERVVFCDGPNKGEIGELVSVDESKGTCRAVILASRDPVIQANKAQQDKNEESTGWVSAQNIAKEYGMKLKILKKALVNLPNKAVRNKGNDIEISVKALPQLFDIIGIKHRAPQKQKQGKAKNETKLQKPKIANLANFMKEVERKLISLNIRTFREDEVTESLDNIVWRGKRLKEVTVSNAIGTRVISIADTDLVPFGIKGTIVDVHESEFEALVIADTELPFGTTLGNRLITKRGFTAKYGDLMIIDRE